MAKSRVNEAGNYTKPTMRKALFQRISQALKVAKQVNGLQEKHRCWLNNTKQKVEGIDEEGTYSKTEGCTQTSC